MGKALREIGIRYPTATDLSLLKGFVRSTGRFSATCYKCHEYPKVILYTDVPCDSKCGTLKNHH